MTAVIQTEGLGKRYRRGLLETQGTLRDSLTRLVKSPLAALRPPKQEMFWALEDVSLEVHEGEVLGLIGRNGAGKTTLLKILSRITKPTTGWAEIRGRVRSLLEVGTGFHGELTGRENAYLSGSILGMSKREIDRKFDEIVAFAEIDKFIDTSVKHYSSGMYVRLAFAVAAHLEPEVLLVDEVLAVGDINFQKKCLGKMGEVAREGRTVVLVSHQLNQIRRLCQRVVWIDDGHIRQNGNTAEVVNAYEAAMSGNGRGGLVDRFGDRSKGEFLNWQVVHPGAEPCNSIRTVEEITFEFALELKQSVRHGVHGIALYNPDRQLMWGWAAYELDLRAGLHELVYKFPVLPLKPGIYTWRVSFYDGHDLIDGGDMVPDLQVLAPTLQHPRDEWSGIMNLPMEFRINQRVRSQVEQ
jgi:ABC-type polysaccharide/polyol phosphate transport system ATPase subunit